MLVTLLTQKFNLNTTILNQTQIVSTNTTQESTDSTQKKVAEFTTKKTETHKAKSNFAIFF